LSKWLTNKAMFDKNTQEFVEKVKDIQLAQDEVLVSFDLEALYPSVPIPGALKQFDKGLKTLKLEKLLATIYTKVAELCMEQTQFQWAQQWATHFPHSLPPFKGHTENKLKRRRLFTRIWGRFLLWFTWRKCWIC
jgi:hypothetical protein